MKSTIKDLWNGNIAPGENCGVGDPEIEHLVMLIERNREKLEQELGTGQKALLTKYIDCSNEFSELITEQAFRDGFCLAGKLLTEIFL